MMRSSLLRARSPRPWSAVLAALLVLATATRTADAATLIRGLGGPSGYGVNLLPANDDGSSASIDIRGAFPGGIRFFGTMLWTAMFVNNNGNITFGGALSTFTPRGFPVASQRMIAPWWGDVDTRGGGQPARNSVWWDIRPAQIVVTWSNVGYFANHDDLQNDFQLIMRAYPECGADSAGDFEVEFRYNRCQWVTGDASGGSGGFGGTPAQAGFDAGDMRNYYALPGSLTRDVLNLCNTSNVGIPGVWRFRIRGGELPCDGSGERCDTGMSGVCAQGTTQCRSGRPTCVPDNNPSAERCDGLDNDCNGMTDEGTAICPAGFVCDQALCSPRCVEGGCFEGQVCNARGVCVEPACRDINCPMGQRCVGGSCVAACDGVICPLGTTCRQGRCVDPCSDVHCDTGNICVNGVCTLRCQCRDCPNGTTCVPDGRCLTQTCAAVTCDRGQVCVDGRCVDPCDGASCPDGEYCTEGHCVPLFDEDGGVDDDGGVAPIYDASDTPDASSPEAGPPGQDAAVTTDSAVSGSEGGTTTSDAGLWGNDKKCSCSTPGADTRPGSAAWFAVFGAVFALGVTRRRRARATRR